jgi:radical SAM superfamily enzyme YgiQ (UPF0313 family)
MPPAQSASLRILLVLPDGRIHKLTLGPLAVSFREAPLTATLLAALIPPEIPAEVRIVDESIEAVPFDFSYDMVGISCLTGTSTRAYQIADRYRAAGVTVVLGGVHVTLMPDEAKQHADAIVIGFAETSWGQLLRDVVNQRLQPVYQADSGQLRALPRPRRDLQKRCGYMIPHTVLATRGCRGNCDFCTVPAAGFGWRQRPIPEVIAEIRDIPARRIAFSDVHLTEDPDYAKALFKALIPLHKAWGGLASTRIFNDDELLDVMHRSGCQFLLIGFESINSRSLASIHKRFNTVTDYQAGIAKLHQLHIIIQGCFIFGLDDDEETIFADTVDMATRLHIDIPRYAIYTPYPGTPAFRRLQAEQRLLHTRWEYYDTQHIVFQPRKMSPQTLEAGFKWAYRETYKLRSILQRTRGAGRNFPIAVIGNLAYKLYLKRLFAEEHRFPNGGRMG